MPGHTNYNPNFPVEGWIPYDEEAWPIADQNMGYINYFMNKDGEVLTVSDTGYTCFTSSIGGVVYNQGDASSYATNKTFAEASAVYDELEEPFFLYVPVNAAHSPFTLPPSGTLYNWDNFYETRHIQAQMDAGESYGDAAASALFVNENAMIENIDYMLSAFLSSISPERKSRTIFILMGDNGATTSVLNSMNKFVSGINYDPADPEATSGMGPVYTQLLQDAYLPQRRGGDANGQGAFKSSVYDRGAQVPMIVAAPFMTTSGTTTSAMVEAIDIYATIADVARLTQLDAPLTSTKPQRFEGVSFLPILSGSTDYARQHSFTEIFHPLGNSTGDIVDSTRGTYTGKVGKYNNDGTLTTTDAFGAVVGGDPTIPYERRRGFAINAAASGWGNYVTSGADASAVYGNITAASAGEWKLVRCTSGATYDELYHIKQFDGTVADPFELRDFVPAAQKGNDLLQYFLDNCANTQDTITNHFWTLARIYYTLTNSLHNLLNERKDPFT